jgi:AcrR family transcriptional regulator
MPRPVNTENRIQRQIQILEAARTIFAEQGVSEARMEDIAALSGLGKGTLYLYYKNKEDLVAGLLEAMLGEFLIQLRQLQHADDKSLEARLLDYVAGVTQVMQTDGAMIHIAYEFYAIAARRPAIRQFLAEYFLNYRQLVADLLTAAIDRGELPPLPVPVAALTFVALLEGLTLLWFTDPQAIPASVVTDAVQNLITSWKQGSEIS